jgi:hypothetical protein
LPTRRNGCSDFPPKLAGIRPRYAFLLRCRVHGLVRRVRVVLARQTFYPKLLSGLVFNPLKGS